MRVATKRGAALAGDAGQAVIAAATSIAAMSMRASIGPMLAETRLLCNARHRVGCLHFQPVRTDRRTMESLITIRAYERRDFDEVVRRWHETNLASFRYVAEHQRHTLADARTFFRDRVLTVCDVRVAERSGCLAGVIALEAPWIRQLAVFAEWQRRGVGTALLRDVRERSPSELRLFTFRRNVAARAFYERHGFTTVAFGVSPVPECEPDVEYRWRAWPPEVRATQDGG
jgi:GNAT superfamily N-acetyltransferase